MKQSLNVANKAKPRKVTVQMQNGERVEMVVPTCPADVENQPNFPAWSLALMAFCPFDAYGRAIWSPFSKQTLKRLQDDYGEAELRKQLMGLLIDMAEGFKPSNPIGLLIHRVRQCGTTKELMV